MKNKFRVAGPLKGPRSNAGAPTSAETRGSAARIFSPRRVVSRPKLHVLATKRGLCPLPMVKRSGDKNRCLNEMLLKDLDLCFERLMVGLQEFESFAKGVHLITQVLIHGGIPPVAEGAETPTAYKIHSQRIPADAKARKARMFFRGGR